MKVLFLIFSVTGLASCGKLDRAITAYTGEFTYKCSKSGVEYVQSDSGIAAHLNPDGSPVKCN